MTPKQAGRNYKTVEVALRDRVPFVHRSMSGEWEQGTYVVKSYSTVVATIDADEKWITSQRYSQTTSKHIAIIRRAWINLDSATRIFDEPAKPANGVIGSQAEADAIAGVSWNGNLPQGWEHMGSGCSRRAYLAPSGVVYKVADGYDDANDTEYLTYVALVLSGAIPEGWDVPMTYRYRVNVNGAERVIIAMENLGHSEVSLYHTNIPVPAGYASHAAIAREVFGVFDSHGGNIRQRKDGALVCIDLGFSALLPDSPYADW
jgi:hypothetical protein